MPGQYPTKQALRPRLIGRARDGSSPRLFRCAACRQMVIICSRCDRGQIYCAGGCAQEARRRRQREAGRRYQSSRRGRLNHAARSRRHRAQKKIVTHQGSPANANLLPRSSAVRASESPPTSGGYAPAAAHSHCDWCGCRCSQFVRQDFLPCRRVRRGVGHDRKGVSYDHPP
jgi:hypothetical protein